MKHGLALVVVSIAVAVVVYFALMFRLNFTDGTPPPTYPTSQFNPR